MALKKIKTPDFMASINEAKMLHSQKEEITEAVCEQTEETVSPKNSCKRSLPKNTNCPKRHSTKLSLSEANPHTTSLHHQIMIFSDQL